MTWRLPAFFMVAFLFLLTAQARCADFKDLSRLLGDKDAVLLLDPDGKDIFSKNASQKLIPASTLKLLTCLFALSALGEDFRFKTEFFTDREKNVRIKGYGDPLLVSEELEKISKNLAERLPEIKNLVMDESYFGSQVKIPGISPSFEPYDAPVGALCVNFNSVYFTRGKNGRPRSAEPQTPLLPMALERIRKYGRNSGRIVFSGQNHENLRYAGHLFHFFLNKAGIPSSGKIIIGRAGAGEDPPLHTHLSPWRLEEVVQKTLEFSNNFMANQLLLTAGAKISGPPATLEKGVSAIKSFALHRLEIPGIAVVEGSGISRRNRISARNMAKILWAFRPHRRLMTRRGYEYYKTGSLKGIRARAGFFETPEGKLFSFCVMARENWKNMDAIMEGLRIIFEETSLGGGI
jgi:serine-type D-Ala-D-Ala carboxypeptidase/endopeptidase (penicillin-binding protein 4)